MNHPMRNRLFRKSAIGHRTGSTLTKKRLTRPLGIETLEDRSLLSVFGVASYTIPQSTVGLFDPVASQFSLRYTNTSGSPDSTFHYGPAGFNWIPIAGDWDGDGIDTIGLFDATTSTFYLRNTNTPGFADITFNYGPAAAGWKPIAGDWNGDGIDTIGLYNPTTSTFYLRNTNDTGYANVTFNYGPAATNWMPIAGDWDADGRSTIGLYDPNISVFYLRNTNTTGFADNTFSYGMADSWVPIAGDWDQDGMDTIGLQDPNMAVFYLRNTNDSGSATFTFDFGMANSGAVPIAGAWTGITSVFLTAETATASTDAATVTQADLTPTVREAIARWASAGLDAATLAKMAQTQIVVRDLTGSHLGETAGDRIYIDSNAAGHGWFVDSTPASDEEFSASGNSKRLSATDPRAVDHIDLLTVVEHELGHIAGLDDVDVLSGSVMGRTLGTGIRRIV